MTSGEKQIVLGTVLGGSTIVKPRNGNNCYLAMRSRNINWLEYKIAELDSFSSGKIHQEGNTYRWRSVCHEGFNEFYELSNRKIAETDLDRLCDVGLAIWFGDKGKMKGNKIHLNTKIFGEDGTALIHHYLNNILEIECKKRKKIIMSQEGSEKFLKIIAHLLPIYDN